MSCMFMRDRIILLRKTLNLGQIKFAKELGYSYAAIQKWEKGGTISEASLKLIERTFNVNPDWLRTGEGEMFLKKEENKYQWLNSLLDKLPEEDVKQIELEVQKILEKQNNKEVNINPTKRIG